jgi:hypothetical protein
MSQCRFGRELSLRKVSATKLLQICWKWAPLQVVLGYGMVDPRSHCLVADGPVSVKGRGGRRAPGHAREKDEYQKREKGW